MFKQSLLILGLLWLLTPQAIYAEDDDLLADLEALVSEDEEENEDIDLDADISADSDDDDDLDIEVDVEVDLGLDDDSEEEKVDDIAEDEEPEDEVETEPVEVETDVEEEEKEPKPESAATRSKGEQRDDSVLNQFKEQSTASADKTFSNAEEGVRHWMSQADSFFAKQDYARALTASEKAYEYTTKSHSKELSDQARGQWLHFRKVYMFPGLQVTEYYRGRPVGHYTQNRPVMIDRNAYANRKYPYEYDPSVESQVEINAAEANVRSLYRLIDELESGERLHQLYK